MKNSNINIALSAKDNTKHNSARAAAAKESTQKRATSRTTAASEKRPTSGTLSNAAIEDAWNDFVAAGNEKGRNNSMLDLCHQWRRSGMAKETMEEELFTRYLKTWPDKIDADLTEQVARAVWKAFDEFQSSGSTRTASTTERRKLIQQKERLAKLRETFVPSRVLHDARVTPENSFAYIDPNIKYADDSKETLAAFMSDFLRTLHGLNTWCFLGKREQSYYNSDCWYYTGMPSPSAKEDALQSKLCRRFYRADDSMNYPEYIANCNFQKPEPPQPGQKCGHRSQEGFSRVVCFTVEADKFLSTGTEPQTETEKKAAKDEQRKLIQWLHVVCGLYPYTVIDSGNKSLQATYLVDTGSMEKASVISSMHYLGGLLSMLGADPSVLSVPRIFRAPQMVRMIKDGDGERPVVQLCLHFDPAAKRYRLPEVIARLENALGAKDDEDKIFDTNKAFQELVLSGVVVGFDSSLLESYVDDPQDFLGTGGSSTEQTLAGDIYNRYKLAGYQLMHHEAATVAQKIIGLYDRRLTLPDDLQKRMRRCWIATQMREMLAGVDPATDAVMEQWFALVGIPKSDLHGRKTLEKFAANIATAAFAGEVELNGEAYGQLCCPIVVGPSGCGKTCLPLSLVPAAWTSLDQQYDSTHSFDMYELQNRLVAEYSECVQFFGPQGEQLKRKLTSKNLEGRQIYGRKRASELRHTCFIMTSNERALHFADSGERRYGIIDLFHLTAEQVRERQATIHSRYVAFQKLYGAAILKRALLDVQKRGVLALGWVGDDVLFHDSVLADHTAYSGELTAITDLFDFSKPLKTNIRYTFTDLCRMANIRSGSATLRKQLQDYLHLRYPKCTTVIHSGRNTFYNLPPLFNRADGICGWNGKSYGQSVSEAESPFDADDITPFN